MLMKQEEDDSSGSENDDLVVYHHIRGRQTGAQGPFASPPRRRHIVEVPEDEDDEDEGLDSEAASIDHDYLNVSDRSSIDEDEYDGAVPQRRRPFSERNRPMTHLGQPDTEESMEVSDDDEYGGSFIDDDEEDEEGYDLESTGSLRDVEENDGSDDLDGEVVAHAPAAEEVNPTMEELRARRLAAAEGRR